MFKNRPKILAAVGAALLTISSSACVDQTGSVSLPSTSLEGTTKDEKALYVAETAFASISAAIEGGVDSGMITPSMATKILPIYQEAKTALDLAREAHVAGNASSVMEQAILVQQLVTKIFGLLK